MENFVEKSGEKFTFQGSIFTAKCFLGNTGEEYPTAQEAKSANETGGIYVKNEEYGGTTPIELSIKAGIIVVQV